MKIKLTSVFVNDQTKAQSFYTEKLGFKVKMDMSVGDFKFITLVSPEEPDGTELLLEPNNNPTAKTYQDSLFKQGIPGTAFVVDDIETEYNRLVALGVKFKAPPQASGPVIQAVLNDTCGNWIQLYQVVQPLS